MKDESWVVNFRRISMFPYDEIVFAKNPGHNPYVSQAGTCNEQTQRICEIFFPDQNLNMASLRPEGALNSARGLVEIGRIDDALEALHDVLGNRRFRQWNSNMEKIAEEYVKLCLMVGKPRFAKDGLIQFRNICQPNNLQSVDGILKMFRAAAEEKVRETRGKLVVGTDGLVDLEEVESGENLLVSALSPEASVVDERAARAALRDLWDTLRVILEVCRNHPALDETYQATAIKAFDFCKYVIHSVSVSYKVRAFYLDDGSCSLLRFNRSAQSNLLDHMITGVETIACLLHFVPMLNTAYYPLHHPSKCIISLLVNSRERTNSAEFVKPSDSINSSLILDQHLMLLQLLLQRLEAKPHQRLPLWIQSSVRSKRATIN